MAEETKFLKKIGVSQELFDRTQKDDKGMNDGKIYDLLLPKPETFEKYGIKNVIGTQNLDVFMVSYPTAVVTED